MVEKTSKCGGETARILLTFSLMKSMSDVHMVGDISKEPGYKEVKILKQYNWLIAA